LGLYNASSSYDSTSSRFNNSSPSIPKFDIRNTALQYNTGKKVKKQNNKALFSVTVIFLPKRDELKIPRSDVR
jgi:hypothetical protein